MISKVITNVHLLNFAVFLLHFCEDLLKELIIMFLHLNIAHSTAQTVSRLGRVLRVTVNVQEGNGSVSRQPSVHCFGGYDRCFESRWSES